MTLAHPEYKKERDSGKYDEHFILFIVPLYFIPIALKQIAEADENTVPNGDSQKRICHVLGKRLFDTSRDKGNVSAAKRNDSAETDGKGAVMFQLCFRGFDTFTGFRKPCFQKRKDSGATNSSNKIAESCAEKAGQDTRRNQTEKGNVTGACNSAAKREYDFAGNRETGVF